MALLSVIFNFCVSRTCLVLATNSTPVIKLRATGQDSPVVLSPAVSDK